MTEQRDRALREIESQREVIQRLESRQRAVNDKSENQKETVKKLLEEIQELQNECQTLRNQNKKLSRKAQEQ